MSWSEKVVGDPLPRTVPCLWPGAGLPGSGECKSFAEWEGRYCPEHCTAFYVLLNTPLFEIEIEGKSGVRRATDMSPEAVAARKLAKAREAEALAYVKVYTGSWGLPLDIRASEKWGTRYLALTKRQVDALLAGKARDDARVAETASDPLIEWLKGHRGAGFLGSVSFQVRAGRPLSPRQREVAQRIMEEQSARPEAPSGPVGPRAEVTEGMYRNPEGTIWKVVVAVHGSGRLYAQKLVIEGTSGRFEYDGGAVRRLDPAWKMTLEQAKEFGSLYGFCVRCGATLTDDVSIKAGIGPQCAGRMGA